MPLLLLLAVCQDNEFSSAEHGFRISRPGAGWTFVPGAGTGDVISTLKVTSREAEVTVYVLDVEGYRTATEARDLTLARRRSEKSVTHLTQGADDVGPWL